MSLYTPCYKLLELRNGLLVGEFEEEEEEEEDEEEDEDEEDEEEEEEDCRDAGDGEGRGDGGREGGGWKCDEEDEERTGGAGNLI
eukprot:301058-Hanusia_phi.AAC.1